MVLKVFTQLSISSVPSKLVRKIKIVGTKNIKIETITLLEKRLKAPLSPSLSAEKTNLAKSKVDKIIKAIGII